MTQRRSARCGNPAEPRKIFAEAEWYRVLPAALKTYVPQFVGLDMEDGAAYEIEYLFLPALSELFCFSPLPAEMWRGILASCREVLEICQAHRPAPHQVSTDFARRFFVDMVGNKSICRLRGFAKSADIDLHRDWTIDGAAAPSLSRLVEMLTRIVGVPELPISACGMAISTSPTCSSTFAPSASNASTRAACCRTAP